MNLDGLDLFQLDDAVWIASRVVHSPAYDFAFDRFFPCRRPWQRPEAVLAIARLGALPDYAEAYDELVRDGIRLVNSPEEHALASELPLWYPHLLDCSPRSEWFDTPPSRALVEERFGWPVFVKGARQTARHSAALSVARDGDAYDALALAYVTDPILRWQQCVIREYVPLRPVPGDSVLTVPPSFEFRTFWLNAELVGAGPYWSNAPSYGWDPREREDALALAGRIARELRVPFLVVDLAQTADERWLVIECNDAQESGYAGVSPFALWSQIVDVAHHERGA